MPLTTTQREAAWEAYLGHILNDGSACRFTKSELRQALGDVTTWIEDAVTRTAFNTGLAEPFKSSATVDEKAQLLAFARMKWYGG